MALIACYMFGRWVQEIFFRFMRQDYAFDKINASISRKSTTNGAGNRAVSNQTQGNEI